MAFTPKTWSTGEVVTAAEMNRIETGVDDAHDLADEALNSEVDGSVELASFNVSTTTATTITSRDLTIPADWASWKCQAYVTFVPTGITSGPTLDMWIEIDGTAQQKQQISDAGNGASSSVGGRRTGMTTTGDRTIAFRVQLSSGTCSLSDIFLYARAVRTS